MGAGAVTTPPGGQWGRRNVRRSGKSEQRQQNCIAGYPERAAGHPTEVAGANAEPPVDELVERSVGERPAPVPTASQVTGPAGSADTTGGQESGDDDEKAAENGVAPEM